MKKVLFMVPLFLLLSLSSCPNGVTDPADPPLGDPTPIYPSETVLITGQTFTRPVHILDHAYDNLVIENCTFQDINGSGLTIVAANNVTVRNCTFTDIYGNGIYLDGNYDTTGITIENNVLTNIWGNGINSKEKHVNVTITGNTITTSGIDLESEKAGAPHHGMYIMGAGFNITANTIRTVVNPHGHGISVRSSGYIGRNIVSDTTNTGIGYFSDHPAGAGQDLIIDNNFVYGLPSQGISVVSNGTNANHIDGEVIIRFNSVVTDNQASVKLEIPLTISIYGNVFVRTDGGSLYVWDKGEGTANEATEIVSHNVTSATDPGFLDMASGDLHISTPANWATLAVTGAPGFPSVDVDGQTRSTGSQYAGADDPDT